MPHRFVSIFRRLGCALLTLAIIFSIAPEMQAQNLTFTPGIADNYSGDITAKKGESADNYIGPVSELVMGVTQSINYDSAGNLYINEPNDPIIRVVAASNAPIPALPGVQVQAGYVYTVAGGANAAPCPAGDPNTGDGCPASQAILGGGPGNGGIQYIAIDAHGNVFMADSGSYAGEIRVVYAGGAVPGLTNPIPGYIYALPAATTYIAQNNATPAGIAVDAQGNIYFGAAYRALIAVIYSGQTVPGNPLGIPDGTAAGDVYTLIGNNCNSVTAPACGDGGPIAQAGLNQPAGVSVDPSGNIYIGDSESFSVRVIYVAGTLPGFSSPTPGNIYTVAGGGISSAIPAAGVPATSLISVSNTQIAFDAVGDIYLAGVPVEKVDTAGNLTAVFGGSGPLGQQGGVYTFPSCLGGTDSYGDGCASTSAGLFNPFGVAIDSRGNIFVSDHLKRSLIRESNVAASALSFTGTVGFPTGNQIVIVSNTSSKPLQLSGLTFTGPFAQAPTGGGATDCTASTILVPAQSCPITVAFTGTSAGTVSGSLAIASNSLNASAGSNTVALSATLAQASSATTLTASPVSPVIVNSGQTITFTATVLPQLGDTLVPTGNVSILNGSATVGTGNLSNGVATIAITNLPAGTLQITAQYNGDANFTGSTSVTPVQVQVADSSAAVANVVLTTSTAVATAGQSVTLTATVNAPGGTPISSGTVTFQDGNNPLGAAVAVNNFGMATLTTSTMPVGGNALVAVFNGASSYGGNTSISVTVTINGGGQLAFTPGVIQKIAGAYPTISDGQYGNPNHSYGGDGGPAGNAVFNFIESIATDNFGNVYLSDWRNNLVRVVASGRGSIATVPHAQAGNVYTFAGGGACTPGPCGDGGLATQAGLSGPRGIAVDAFGNVYILDGNDYGNGASTVRKVNPQGTIQTIVGSYANGQGYAGDGGPATSAQINAASMFVDNSGDIYIADGGNGVIRRVDALTTVITTVAGTPGTGCSTSPCGDGGQAINAFLTNPNSVAIDVAGNLYIADSGDAVVRRVDSKSAVISTFAGSYTNPGSFGGGFNGGFSGDGGAATSAQISDPTTVTLDNAGNLYIMDAGNQRVRVVNAQTSAINTIIGGGSCTPTSGPCGDGGLATNAELDFEAPIIALDNQGNLYVVHDEFGVIREVPVVTSAANFGSQNLGTNNTQIFTVTNIGAAPLSLTGVALATTSPVPPPSPSDFVQQPSGNADCVANMQLASGLSCAIDVQWFPTIVQPEAATVTIASNATNSTAGSNVISLNGTGVGSSGTSAQTITFPGLQPSYPYGTPISLTATTSATGEVVTYRIIGPATLNGTTVTPTGIGTVTVTAYQFGSSQYASATPVSQTFIVTPAPLTVTAANLSLPVETPVTQPAYAVTGFVGTDNQASVVTGTPVLTITNPQTNAVIPVGSTPSDGAYPITITQGTLSAGPNYALNFVDGMLSVTGSQGQTINFTSLPNTTYGVTPIALNAVSIDAGTKANTGLPVTFTATGPATVAGNLLTITGAGAVAVTANQAGGSNYAAATPVTVSFTVAPAPLTVTAGNLSVAENAPLPTLTADYTFSGFVNGDGTAALSGTPALTTTTMNTSVLGSSAINIAAGSLSSANYIFASFVPGTLTVVVGTPQTISFPSLAPVVYGTAPITLSAKSSSGLGVSYTVISGPATVAGNTLAITGAGAVTVVANQPGAASYSPAAPVPQTITVAPAVLMLTANNATRVDDIPNPTFTYTLTGFVNGDTQGSATSGQPLFTTTATPSSPIGTYAIIPEASYTNSGGLQTVLSAANYTFIPVNGTLTITSGGPVAGFSLTATPQQLNILLGASAQATINLNPVNYYQALVALSCGTLPANVQCTFSPATVSPDGTGAVQTTTLAITTNNSVVVGRLDQKNNLGAQAASILCLPAGVIGLLLVFQRRRLLKNSKMQHLLTLAVLFTGLIGLAACGTAVPSAATGGATPGTYTVTVTAKGQDGTTNTVPISIQIR